MQPHFVHYTCIILANMHHFILLMSVRGGLAVMEGGGVCCVCTLRSSYQSGEFMYHGLCPGLHTGNNNSYGCSRHPPAPTTTTLPASSSDPPGPPKTHVCQSHNSCPPTFPFSTPPTPTTRTRLRQPPTPPDLILLLCKLYR